jgi:hypothetical protein
MTKPTAVMVVGWGLAGAIVVETHERIHDGRPRQYHEAPTHPGYTHVATFSMVTIVSS